MQHVGWIVTSHSVSWDYPSLVRMDYYLLFSTQRDDHPIGRMACYLSQITLGSYHILGWMDYQRYLSILGNYHSLLKIDYHLLSSTQGDYHPSDRMVSYLSQGTLGNNHTLSRIDCDPSLITMGDHTSYSVLQIVWMSCWFPFFKMETNLKVYELRTVISAMNYFWLTIPCGLSIKGDLLQCFRQCFDYSGHLGS